jgi:glycine/D-amino acid oxidase-like deaminating enzyme
MLFIRIKSKSVPRFNIFKKFTIFSEMSNHQSYWEKKNFFKADIIIVGSGIVGLNAALTIKEALPKAEVLVLERGFLPTGASTKNAGFACFGSISELIVQEESCGTDGLHELISKRWRGLLKLRKTLGDGALSYQNNGGFELFKTEDEALAGACVAKLSHFNALIEDIVKEKEVYTRSDRDIETFGFKGITTLIKNKLEAQLDPGKMMRALLARVNAAGVCVLNNCAVSGIDQENDGLAIDTSQGLFRCRRALLTTNAFISELLPGLDVVPGRGQVLVTKPIANLKIKGTFHYDRGYYYFRNIDNRLLLGGGRNIDFKAEETTEFGATEKVMGALQNLMQEVILPGTFFEIDQAWSGIMAFGSAITPIVKEVKPYIYCAVRCNGMGIAVGSFTGQEAGEMVVNSL